MTGVTLMAVEFLGKRLELLQEIVPSLRRVAILGNPEHPGAQLERAFSEETAQQLGLTIDYRPSRTREELVRVLDTISADPPQAISLLADGFAIQNRQTIFDFAARQRVPVISGWPIFARSGAICTYGPRQTESYRRLAYYVDRILKGAKPADLPVRAADQVRAGDQSQDRQGARPHDAADAARPRRRGDRISAPAASWCGPAGASPAQVKGSSCLVASVAWPLATVVAKRTQQLHGVWD